VYNGSLLYQSERDHSPIQALQRRGERADGEVDCTTSVEHGARHFIDSVDALFEHSLRGSIHNANNQQDRPIGLSFRRIDQISRMFCGVCLKKLHNQMPDTRLRILSHFTCIPSRCLWVLAGRRQRRKEDFCPRWLILNEV